MADKCRQISQGAVGRVSLEVCLCGNCVYTLIIFDGYILLQRGTDSCCCPGLLPVKQPGRSIVSGDTQGVVTVHTSMCQSGLQSLTLSRIGHDRCGSVLKTSKWIAQVELTCMTVIWDNVEHEFKHLKEPPQTLCHVDNDIYPKS